MNLSMQIGRGLIALGLSLVFGAYAFSLEPENADADTSQVNVAHNRLVIADLHDNSDASHWVVASVHVGDPIAVPAARQHAVASRIRSNNNHS
jgi:hypothetical protein